MVRCFLLGNLMARGIDVSGGLWVSSGAVTGVHQAVVGQSVSASFGDLGTVSCTLTQAQPR
jgi:2-keto-4-pentenoate hydratase